MDQLRDIFKNVLNIHDENCLREVCGVAKVSYCKKGENIVLQGEVQRELPFLVKGAFLGYYTDGDGRRYTDCITDIYGCPITSVAEPSAFLLPSDVSFEALEDSEVICLPMETVIHTIMTYKEVEDALNSLVREWLGYHRRLQRMNTFPLRQRYETFCEYYPELTARLNKTSIATCLGVSLPALSRALATKKD